MSHALRNTLELGYTAGRSVLVEPTSRPPDVAPERIRIGAEAPGAARQSQQASGMKHTYLTVNDLMTTAVVTIRASETVDSARTDMQMGVFRHLPVLDARGRLVGILSDRDVLRALQRPRETLVAEVMTREPVTVTPTMSAHLAAKLMVDRTISSLPVVNEEGRLVGLLTATDFLEVARRALLRLPLDAGG